MAGATKNAKEMIDVLTIQLTRRARRRSPRSCSTSSAAPRPQARSGGMSTGKIVQVIGPVVDVEFEPADCRASTNALLRRGRREQEHLSYSQKLTLEVAQHLGESRCGRSSMAATDVSGAG